MTGPPGLYINIQNAISSDVIRDLVICMQSGMPLLRIRNQLLGWVHPTSRTGDKIFRVFSCSELIVLRASDNGDHYQTMGDAHLFSMKDVDLRWTEEQVESLKIL